MPRLVDAAYESNWTSAVGALAGVLRALGCGRPAHEVSALSGHAFRFALTSGPDGEMGPDGPNHFAAHTALPLYESLGWRFEAIEALPEEHDFAKRRDDAIKRLRRSIDKGRPVVAFGLHLPEFGIVRGYDGEALIASTTVSSQYGERVPLSQWPAPGHPLPLRLFLPEKRLRPDRRQALERLLRFVVAHAERGEAGAPGKGSAMAGLAAFDRWTAVLEGEAAISPHGQAYCIQALQSARKDAAAFLRMEAAEIGTPPLVRAAAAYETVVLELSRLATLFPYPNGGDVASPGVRRVGASYVRRARAAEQEAVTALEQAPAG